MEIEAGASVSAVTGALKPILQKLAALLGNEEYYKHRLRGPVRKEIKSLADELTAMHVSLLKMSEEDPDDDAQDKAWMNEVRELSYDMEDSMDDFMKRIHNDKADEAHPGEGFMEKMKNSLGHMKARRLIGTEIHNFLKKQLIEVGETNDAASYYNKTHDETHDDSKKQIVEAFSHATIDPRAFAIFDHTSKFINEPKAELIKLLVEEDGCVSTQQQVKLVSIVGPTGGKALAKQVYRELSVQFQCTAFVSMSPNSDMMVLTAVLSQVT